ncbi:MAG: hypothetical protein ACLP7Q_27320 [Isosphaeraceae bacterium]
MNRSGIRIVRLLAFAGLTLLSARADAATMQLTAAATAQGFGLSTFAADFPNSGGIGPIGIAFPVSGGVLVTGYPSGTLNLFPTDTDNQSYSDAGVTHQHNFNSPLGHYYTPSGLTESGGKVYLTVQQFGGPGSIQPGVYQLNDNGTVNHLVTALAGATGIATNPTNGHLFVSTLGSRDIYDVNPSTGVTVNWTAAHHGAGFGADGLTFSPDGRTLYAAVLGSSVQGYNINTGSLVFSASVPLSDGTALGVGSIAGNIFANANDGKLWEINLTTGVQTLIASGGSRGDFVTVDPTNGTLLLTQTDRILRLTAPQGGGFSVPEPPSLALAGMGGLILSVYGLYALRRRRRAIV